MAYNGWNPWHGCTKISAGCKYCYVYRGDERRGIGDQSRICRRTENFDYPIRKNRSGDWKVPPGSFLYTCFTSDFLLEDADQWRPACWEMMRTRSDVRFCFFTKRIDRLEKCLPPDWGDGYDNVTIGCTVENQDRADYRLPIFRDLPIKHRLIIVGPMLEKVDIARYLDEKIDSVTASGESGTEARVLDYDWVLDLRGQCVEHGIPFFFHQTGAHFVKDGRFYNIPRKLQMAQARKAGIDYMFEREKRDSRTVVPDPQPGLFDEL